MEGLYNNYNSDGQNQKDSIIQCSSGGLNSKHFGSLAVSTATRNEAENEEQNTTSNSSNISRTSVSNEPELRQWNDEEIDNLAAALAKEGASQIISFPIT